MYLHHRDLSKYWVVDLEGDALVPKKLWCLVAVNVATKEKRVAIGHEEIRRFFDTTNDCYYVGHNFISWDAPNSNRLTGSRIPTGRIIDTLVLSYLYNPAIPGGHSLEDWAVRLHLDVQKDHFNDFTQFSLELLARCEADVEINLRVFLRLTERMREIGYSEESCSIEHDIRHVVNLQERNGFAFDVPGARRLLGELRGREAALAGVIQGAFPPVLVEAKRFEYKLRKDGQPYQSYLRHLEAYPRVERDGPEYVCLDWKEFNLGSPDQRVEKLLGLGWKPSKFTKGGSPQVDEESLLQASEELGKPELKLLADWLVENGRGNMVQTWLDCVSEDGMMHGKVFTCGAMSRRMRHNKPNTANIPSNEAKYGHECRSLWTARPNRVLVGYDAAASQMRIFGHYLGNREAAEVYIHGKPHQRNADMIGHGETYKQAKNHFYAFIFGAQDPKLGRMVGKGPDFGKFVRAGLYASTPGLEELVNRSQEEYRLGKGRLKCLDGGYVICPSPHAALNYYVQPGEACVLKKAAIFLHKRAMAAGIDHLKVGDIHDEAQHDTAPRDADRLGNLACECIKDAGEHFNLIVPMAGGYKVGSTWADTH